MSPYRRTGRAPVLKLSWWHELKHLLRVDEERWVDRVFADGTAKVFRYCRECGEHLGFKRFIELEGIEVRHWQSPPMSLSRSTSDKMKELEESYEQPN